MCVFNFSMLYNLTHFGSPPGSKWGEKGQKGHKLIIAVKMAKRSMSFGIGVLRDEKFNGEIRF